MPWREQLDQLIGPLVTTAVIAGLALASWQQANVLYLPIVLLLAVAFSAYVGGFQQGFISAGLSWVFLCFYLFTSPLPVRNWFPNWIVWTAALPAVALLTGYLHRRACEQEFKPWRGNVAPFRLASESVPDLAVILLDRDANVTSWNTGAGAVFGLSSAEMTGQSMKRCFDAQEITDGAPEKQLKAASDQGRFEGELWCVRKTGGRFRAKISIATVRDDDNKVAGFTVSVQDLTERQEAESAMLLRAHQQVAVAALSQAALVGTDLRVLFDHAVTFITQTWAVDCCEVFELQQDGRTLLMRAGVGWKSGLVGHLSVEATEDSMLGYALRSPEPVIVKDLRSITHFAVPAFLKEHNVAGGILVVIPGQGAPIGLIGAHTMREGRFGEDDLSFLQAVASVLGTAHARRLSDMEKEKLAAFPQFNPNPVYEFAADGQLTYFNGAASTMALTLKKAHPTELLPPETPRLVSECLASGASRLGLDTQHSGRTISWSFYPVPAIGRVHLYAVEITERVNLEGQLRQSQKLEAIGQLASGVAHDFNNILTIMQGYASRLLAKTPREDQRDDMEQILNSAERAAALTKQLLAFSRKQTLQPRPLDLRETVANMSRMFERLIGENISLKVRRPDTLPAVNADASMMEQVLLNLAVNARDAMPEGGELRVETDAVSVDAVYAEKVAQARPGNFVRLKVADTGCGMAPATLSRIFEPFFTTKGPGKGTGLGLATVYGIVQQHAGWVEVESQVGCGTTFAILLPAVAGEVAVAKVETESPDAPRGGSETILFVEDEALLRELGRASLEELGYKVLEATTGLEAVILWKQHREQIDLLFTDMVMPGGLTGRELSERFRADKPELRVILSTGYSADVSGMDFGAGARTAFLQKPYRPPVLAKTVRACLDAK
ncbi:MAG: response regulator [Verrucomicrobia bacterium]|nr:response regulator [Verrucomicrobiota bacterium]